MSSRDPDQEARFDSEESSTTTKPASLLTPSSGTGTSKGFSHVMDMIGVNEPMSSASEGFDSGKAGLCSPAESPVASGTTARFQFAEARYSLDSIPGKRAVVEPPFPQGPRPGTGEQVLERVRIKGRLTFLIICPFLIREFSVGPDMGGQLGTGPSRPTSPEMICQRLSELSELSDSDASGPARLALEIIRSEPKDHDISFSEDGKIAFDRLHLLFPAGSTLYSRDEGGWRAYKVDRVERASGEAHAAELHVHAFYVNFNETGKRLVPHYQLLVLPWYSSTRRIRSLAVWPDWYIHKTYPSLPKKLIERGTDFQQLYGGSPICREYKGDAWPVTLGADPVRVIIDYTTPSKHPGASCPARTRECVACLGARLRLKPYGAGVEHDEDLCTTQGQPRQMAEADGIDDVELRQYCPSRVWAFSLRHGSWREVRIMDLHEPLYSDVSNTVLYIPANAQHLLESQVRSYLDGNGDTTLGGPPKRRGNNILLQGDPGSGKTFIVEYLANKYKRPLYSVSCASFGIEPDVMETRLEAVLRSAANWRVLLLLEDVAPFFRDRDPHHPRTNALNSAFRFQLAQSEALVFMTAVDPRPPNDRLLSHVDHALRLLGISSCEAFQEDVWESAIQSLSDEAKSHRVRLEKVLTVVRKSELAMKMDGRQIHACVRAASALAKQRGCAVDESHIHEVIMLAETFRDSFRAPRTNRVATIQTVQRGGGQTGE
ncbi:hypothetical protein N657DRAFT_637902 [Parathielavia appendiculata]|uniref:AAA+ ATPase domain-containing protein n=1 Tax=Parathielavia appendiculata TaxID=2587402 RepID=A0AAN6TQ46_9PEZI|nr:hypothetical protein N657DRAFT_637902 [Parathielavia appendiculata]